MKIRTEIMTEQERLIVAVLLMRQAQKAYFQNKTKENLLAAKNLEWAVDHKLKQITSKQSNFNFDE